MKGDIVIIYKREKKGRQRGSRECDMVTVTVKIKTGSEKDSTQTQSELQ